MRCFFSSARQLYTDYVATMRAVVAVTSVLFFNVAFSPIANAQQIKSPAQYQQCAACHGASGEGNPSLNAPAIAGLSQTYLARQLVNFHSGIRGSDSQDTLGQQMQAMTKGLDKDKDIPVLVAYLANLSPVNVAQQTQGDLTNGTRYYQGKCGACHGGQAQGNEAFNAPRLAGQDIDYLKRQMHNFVTGLRGTHSEDKYGRQMAMMAKTTSGKELDDILHYIAVQE